MILVVGAIAVPTASALDLSVSAPAVLPSPPQVSNPLPPLSTAVPGPMSAPPPEAPVSVTVPAPPAGVAQPLPAPGARPALPGTTAVRMPAGRVAASAGTPSPAQLSPQQERRRRAARQTRRLRRAVMRMKGCLPLLDRHQERYLSLRAGVGRPRPLGRGAAAKRVGVPREEALRYERRALGALEHVCGGHDSGRAAAELVHTHFAVAGAGPSPVGGTSVIRQVAQSPRGEREVLGRNQSGDREEPRNRGVSEPSTALPRTSATVPDSPGRDALSGAWVIAALALLALVAGASLLRRRARAEYAVAAEAVVPPRPPQVAPAPAAALRTEPEELVSHALELLSAGAVGEAAALMHPDVHWPDPGGETIEGRSQFEAYWGDRLAHVVVGIEPVGFERRNGELVVEVNEVVRSRATQTIIGEYHAVRRFRFRDGLIAEMKHGRL